MQFFREHPPLTLVEYCTEPVITEALQNLTELEEESNGTFLTFDNETFIEDLPVFDDEPNSALFSFILQVKISTNLASAKAFFINLS